MILKIIIAIFLLLTTIVLIGLIGQLLMMRYTDDINGGKIWRLTKKNTRNTH